MKKLLIAAVALSAVFSAAAGELFRNDDDAAWVCGPKLTPEYLKGRVVLVDCWGINCPPCRALLPKLEKAWRARKDKPFVLVGAHVQGRDDAEIKKIVSKAGLSYPVYQQFGIAQGAPHYSGIPFLYVVDHRGKVVYSGANNEPAAMAAVDKAIAAIDGPINLLAGFQFKKYAGKGYDKKAILGKDISGIVKALERDSNNEKDQELAAEAKQILDRFESERKTILEDIELLKEGNPPLALSMIKGLKSTFPDEYEKYKDSVADLQAAATKYKADQKKAEAERKKAEKEAAAKAKRDAEKAKRGFKS